MLELQTIMTPLPKLHNVSCIVLFSMRNAKHNELQLPLLFGKRHGVSAIGQNPDSKHIKTAFTNSIPTITKAIFDYVFAQNDGDQQLFLERNIYGRTFLGLVDLGALKLKISCTVANARHARLMECCRYPFNTRIVQQSVIHFLPHTLILGTDF